MNAPPGNESSPGQGAALTSNTYDDNDTVGPVRVQNAIVDATMAELLEATDPTRHLLDLIAGLRTDGWLRCRRCRRRTMQVRDSVVATCTLCGPITRWTVGRDVLGDVDAIERLLARRTA